MAISVGLASKWADRTGLLSIKFIVLRLSNIPLLCREKTTSNLEFSLSSGTGICNYKLSKIPDKANPSARGAEESDGPLLQRWPSCRRI